MGMIMGMMGKKQPPSFIDGGWWIWDILRLGYSIFT
jgi:hypothetical protein